MADKRHDLRVGSIYTVVLKNRPKLEDLKFELEMDRMTSNTFKGPRYIYFFKTRTGEEVDFYGSEIVSATLKKYSLRRRSSKGSAKSAKSTGSRKSRKNRKASRKNRKASRKNRKASRKNRRH